MAIIKFGGGITDARGSLAGNTFTRSRAGSVVRQRVAPIQPNTPQQSAMRAMLASAVAEYASGTAAEIQAWQAFADQITKTNKLGDTYTPSAIQTFVSYYVDQTLIGGSPSISSVPASPYQPEIVKIDNVTLDSSGGGLIDNFTFEPVSALAEGANVLVQATPPHAPALQNASKLFRTLEFDPNAPWLSDATVDIETAYGDRFGLAGTVGEIIDFRVKLVRTAGLSSAWYYAKAPIVLLP